MRVPWVSPTGYRRLAVANLVCMAAIVVTGGAVRLTGSGLGCPTWPRCTDHSLTAALSFHPLVEFGNRVLTTAVGIVVAAAVLGALRRRPFRRDLLALSGGLVAGFCAQAVIGGLSVLYHLSPPWVMAHFLVSMVLVWDSYLLVVRAGTVPGRRRPAVRREVLWLGRGLTAVAGLILAVGTVVTGTGPNSGAPAVRRLPFELRAVAQLHADIVMFAVGGVVVLAVALRVLDAPAPARRRAGLLVAVMLAQSAVGFTQYFLGLAAARPLVLLHVAGATAFWLATLAVGTALTVADPEPVAVPVPVPSPATAPASVG